MHSDNEIKNEIPIFEERLPPFVLGTTLRTHLQVMAFVWFIRACSISILILLFILVRFSDDGLVTIGGIIGGALLILIGLWISEYFFRGLRSASVKFTLTSEGVHMYAFPYQRLLGFTGFIAKEDMAVIEIRRGRLRQNIDYRRDIRWEDAPVGFLVVTLKGKSYYSGPKPPGQVIALTSIIKEMWNVSISDAGAGEGNMTMFVDGSPVDK